MERILDKRIKLELDITGAIDNNQDQEGFLKARSTTRYLFRLLCNLGEIKKKRLACIILFLDFQKAFHSVHLPSLIVKLSEAGITGDVLALIHNLLFNRLIHLKINSHLGKARPCHNFGLPQGSVLSPLLFILYVTDMIDEFPLELKMLLSGYKIR